MEIEYKDNTIALDKVLNSLDNFVIEFTTILNKLNIKYVLISGYVAILFGRSRSSEDIDLFIEEINYEKFTVLWQRLYDKFECLATDNTKDAYEDYLKEGLALRFSYKGEYIPNMEMKFPKKRLDNWSLVQRKKVILNNHAFFISPIEIQIAYKLFLGSEKDIEDAKHLYNVFDTHLDMELLNDFIKKLRVGKLMRYLQ